MIEDVLISGWFSDVVRQRVSNVERNGERRLMERGVILGWTLRASRSGCPISGLKATFRML